MHIENTLEIYDNGSSLAIESHRLKSTGTDFGYGEDVISIALIDDDEDFGALMEYLGTEYGVNIIHFRSMTDLGSVGRLADFDAVVLDYKLDQITGIEIAEYLDAFFPWIPAILTSGEEYFSDKKELPKSISTFISKSCGAANIIRAAQFAFKYENALG